MQVAVENPALSHLREEDVQMFTSRIGHATTSATCSPLGARPVQYHSSIQGTGSTKGSCVPKKAK